MTDKAVILARGLGTRMRREDPGAGLSARQEEVAATGVKALIPLDRPFLDYVLHALAEAGCRRICLVVGPEHDELRRYYGQVLRYERLRVSFAVQEKPRGTADAVASAEEFAGRDPFLMINSDNYYPIEALRGLRELDGPGLVAFERDAMIALSNIPAERVTQFAVLDLAPDGRLRRIVEKPSAEVIAAMSRPVCVSMNCWRFDGAIFPACRAIPPSPRGELEIPDAVQYAMARLGKEFRILFHEGAVLDLTSRSDVEPVTRRLAGTEVRL
jgi:glucose-1-phosphate thymidylyltransferase